MSGGQTRWIRLGRRWKKNRRRKDHPGEGQRGEFGGCCCRVQVFRVWWRFIKLMWHPQERLPEFPAGSYSSLLWSREKAMAPHSSTLAWKIPWTEEPGVLQSMGSLGVGQDWATSLSLFPFMHWRRKWQPTPVFLPGESQGWGSLVGCHLWGHTELDTPEVT